MEQESKIREIVGVVISFICSTFSLLLIIIASIFFFESLLSLPSSRVESANVVLVSILCVLSFLSFLPYIIIKKIKEHRTSIFQKILCLFIILIEFGCIIIYLLPPQKFTLILTKDANVLSEPNINSSILQTEKKGTIFDDTVVSDVPDWYKVKVNETDGYIHKSVGREKEKENSFTNSKFFDNILIIIFIAIIITILHFLGKLFSGPFTSCPSCKRWWAKEEVGRELIGSEEDFETVTKKFDIKRDRDGQKTGEYIDMPVNVLVKTSHYINYYRCKKCGYEWSRKTTSKSEV